jgi:hypothetical protein
MYIAELTAITNTAFVPAGQLNYNGGGDHSTVVVTTASLLVQKLKGSLSLLHAIVFMKQCRPRNKQQ